MLKKYEKATKKEKCIINKKNCFNCDYKHKNEIFDDEKQKNLNKEF